MLIMLRQWNDIWRGWYRICWTCAVRLQTMMREQLIVKLQAHPAVPHVGSG
jgi:hypothetical protein